MSARIPCMMLAIAMMACSPAEDKEDAGMEKNVVFLEDFSNSEEGAIPAGWWVEGGERVAVEDGRLRMVANPKGKHQPGYVCTAWSKQAFSGNLQVEFDACVLASTTDANNINLFLLYSDPAGNPLHETRESRADAAYKYYHDLNGYIFTFLNDFRNEGGKNSARMRMRRCPGFQLMTETFDYHCQKDVIYHVTITIKDGRITLAVDGKIYLEGQDDHPWTEGLIGLRTFQTDLWWDHIKVTQVK